MQNTYSAPSRILNNEWITSPSIKDPENIPQPLGWHVLIRPYPVKSKSKGGIIMTSETDTMNYLLNIGRVVAVGPCAWNRPEHKNREGESFLWANVGDFVTYPKHAGHKRKYKDVSFIIMNDENLNEILRDPVVFSDENFVSIDIPQEDLEQYNTIYNKEFMKGQK